MSSKKHKSENPMIPNDDPSLTLRVPPHSIEAESSVLGALLLDNNAWDRVSDILLDTDFYRHEHRLIFGAIGSLVNASKPADVVTVYERLVARSKSEDFGGLEYLNGLAQFIPSAANIRRYAEIVKDRSVLRRLVSMSHDIATSAFNPGSRTVAELLDEVQQKVFAIGDQETKSDEWQTSDAGIVQVLDQLQERHDNPDAGDYIPTGIVELDEKLNGGLRPGKVYVIAARPSMGKTSLAMSIGEHVATNEGKPVGLMSMEMPKEEVQERRMAMKSGVRYDKILRPERMSELDWSSVSKTVETIRLTPLYVTDQSALTINQLRSKARALKRRHGLSVLVIDYIGLMESTDRKASRAERIGEISRGIKALAKELGIAILLLSQLNREVEKRPNQRPILADLRESGDIEQDADVVLFVHRPYQATPDMGSDWKEFAELVLAKHRGGACGVLSARFQGQTMLFSNWKGERPTSLTRTKGGEL
jgi:replicative DNA helicase